MSKQTVIASDLTGKLVPPSEQVTLTVVESPYLDHPVKLDAAASELTGLDSSTEYVVLEVTDDTGSRRLLVEAAQFVTLFKEDVAATLAKAEPLRGKPRRDGQPKTDLAPVRAWLREQGHQIADKGRVPAELQALYDAAHVT